MIDSAKLRLAVAGLPASAWDDVHTPNLDALKAAMANDDVTYDDVGEAFGDSKPQRPEANKETGAGPAKAASKETVTPAVKAQEGDQGAPAASDDSLKANPVAALAAIDDDLAKAKAFTEEKLAERNVVLGQAKAEETMTEGQKAAAAVKLIQQQTIDTKMAAKARQEAADKLLGTIGISKRNFASPLDQQLASGQGKRTVVLRDGKPYVAPAPRSQEGIRNQAIHFHQRFGSRANIGS